MMHLIDLVKSFFELDPSSNEYLVAKIDFVTAENKCGIPSFLPSENESVKVCQELRTELGSSYY